MGEELRWHTQEHTLILHGELDRDTLLTLWKKRQLLLVGIRFLDVSNLRRVDSAGVALMLHFCYYQQQQRNATLAITGVTDRLRTLIVLYKLQEILPYITVVAHESSSKLPCS
ncbi:lipid asymmetry maintenance protein MlaB [Candidatus Doolittlea endobia]|uniref:Putative phospholipid ABC transporter-binding protein MlaB n=1 Tax=Candidatus Doolittlea endobia TaxID=1778262 RepID=A0A143WRP0_9ENTR|nr:lipid asymmetry maintenance protein MlaB [Candidatus Doolittlea endobia]CUX96388.1 putative phospholipid ABC transporter-binding protein MlaB [Candidatus Doolittlea endobia]